VKKFKSVESMFECENTLTSLTGRPGMSSPSQECVALARVRLGKHLSSNGGKGLQSAYKVTFVRLDLLFRNF
jgi:hypothetical protein